jgi:hypothetical protein
LSRASLARLCILALSSSALACIEEQRYHVVDQTVVLTADAQPAYVTEDDEPVFRVDRAFSLRITPPSARALAALAEAPADVRGPYPRLPWVGLRDLDLQLDYALENQGSEATVVTITLNGVNEFHYYAPGPENFHQWEQRVALAPGERIHGSVTDVELAEVAVDLATVVNGAPNSNLVVDARSQSDRDPRVAPFIPPTIPGLVGIRAGLETGAALPLTLTLSIRGSDHGDRAAKRSERTWMLPMAAPFTPVVPDID